MSKNIHIQSATLRVTIENVTPEELASLIGQISRIVGSRGYVGDEPQDVLPSEKPDDPVLNKLGWSARAVRHLERVGVRTLTQARVATETQVMERGSHNVAWATWWELLFRLRDEHGTRLLPVSTPMGDARNITRDTRIEELNFGRKTYNALKKYNIQVVGDIETKTIQELRHIRLMGVTGMTEILTFMYHNHLSFASLVTAENLN